MLLSYLLIQSFSVRISTDLPRAAGSRGPEAAAALPEKSEQEENM
jgi:hypothetical protein